MTYLLCFQIDKHKAFENVVIEYEVYIKVSHIGTDMLLTGNKGIPFSQFHNEFLKMGDYCTLQFSFREFCILSQP